MSCCGTRTAYVTGCRCDACREANRTYARERDRQQRRVAYGIEEPVVRLVDATEAREHLRWLRSFGVGLRTVSALTGLGRSALQEIRDGVSRRVKPDTERKIVNIYRDTRHQAMLVDATRTWQRIDWLQEQGWAKARIARELGFRTPALQINRTRVTWRTEQRVEQLVRRVLVNG